MDHNHDYCCEVSWTCIITFNVLLKTGLLPIVNIHSFAIFYFVTDTNAGLNISEIL